MISRAQDADYPYAAEDVYRATLAAIEGLKDMKVKQVDPIAKQLEITTRMGLGLYRDRVVVRLSPVAPTMTRVFVSSALKFGSPFSGRHRERNLSKLFSAISAQLAQTGLPVGEAEGSKPTVSQALQVLLPQAAHGAGVRSLGKSKAVRVTGPANAWVLGGIALFGLLILAAIGWAIGVESATGSNVATLNRPVSATSTAPTPISTSTPTPAPISLGPTRQGSPVPGISTVGPAGGIQSRCPQVELPPMADPSTGVALSLQLEGVVVRQGYPVTGKLVLRNNSQGSVDFYWEEQLPQGILLAGALVGGVRQAGGGIDGYSKRTIGPGQKLVFPYAVNTLGCPVAPAPRTPLPPGQYQAMALIYDALGRHAWYVTAPIEVTA